MNVSLTGGQATMTGPILAPAGSILQVSVSGNIHSPGATGILARRGIDTILVDGDIGCHIVANYDNSDPGSGRLRSLLCGSLHGDMSATTLGDDDPYSSDPAVANSRETFTRKVRSWADSWSAAGAALSTRSSSAAACLDSSIPLRPSAISL